MVQRLRLRSQITEGGARGLVGVRTSVESIRSTVARAMVECCSLSMSGADGRGAVPWIDRAWQAAQVASSWETCPRAPPDSI